MRSINKNSYKNAPEFGDGQNVVPTRFTKYEPSRIDKTFYELSTPIITDSLGSLLEMQAELMCKVEEKDDTKNTAKDSIIALMVEAAEYLNEEGSFKWWKKNHIKNEEKILEEFIDIFFFWLQAAIKSGYTKEDIYTAYSKKWETNMNRQKENY